MKPVKIITGMANVAIGDSLKDAYTYRVEFVGRALVPRGWGICDYLQNTLTGYQEINLSRMDGSTVKESIPLVDNYIEAGMCDVLRQKYF